MGLLKRVIDRLTLRKVSDPFRNNPSKSLVDDPTFRLSQSKFGNTSVGPGLANHDRAVEQRDAAERVHGLDLAP